MRKFIYDGREFPDPGEHLTADQVRASMVTFFPELSNATIDGPRKEGDIQVFEFKRRVGTKGKWLEPLDIEIDDGWRPGCASYTDATVVVKLSHEEYRELEKRARERGVTPNEMVAQMLTEAVREQA